MSGLNRRPTDYYYKTREKNPIGIRKTNMKISNQDLIKHVKTLTVCRTTNCANPAKIWYGSIDLPLQEPQSCVQPLH